MFFECFIIRGLKASVTNSNIDNDDNSDNDSNIDDDDNDDNNYRLGATR